MPLIEFVCYGCGDSCYRFEEDLRKPNALAAPQPKEECHCGTLKYHRMPPRVTIIHRTEIFMTTQLDTVHTIHDLDAKLQTEAADEREVKQQNAARKEL